MSNRFKTSMTIEEILQATLFLGNELQSFNYLKERLKETDLYYSLSKATATTLGGIKIGTGLSIDADGLVSIDIDGFVPATELPLAAGTAAKGSSTKYAREDHVHPVQTTVSGNAGTATQFESTQDVTLTGDVTGSASSQAGWSVATTLSNSGVTAGSYGPSANASPSHSGTFSVPYITVDSKGRVTEASTKTITLPADNNTIYSDFVKSGSGAKAGLVPAPSTTEGTTKYLREDGTWQVPPNTTYTAASATPLVAGIGTPGTSVKYAREDHVHPVQTAISGNAGTATKLATARTIDGVDFDGSTPATHYGTCSTSAATTEKVVACTNFKLASGSRITITFTVTNTATNPTLNVNSTGAKAIQYRKAAITAGYLAANRTYEFVYDGTQYQLVGDIDSDSNNATAQNVSTANATYPVLLGATADATANIGNKATLFGSGVKVNPSTSTVVATTFQGALSGNANTATKFSAAQSVALTGDVTGSTSSQAGWSIATTLANSGVTAGSYGPSANASPAHSGTFSVPYITVDSKGRVTAASTKTITLPADKDTTYTLSSLGIGNVKNYDQSKAISSITRSGTTFTYTCLDGTTGTFTQQDNNTTYSNMTAATADAAGKAGLVPAPAAGKQTSFLRGDGTWVVPTNTTYSNFVKSGSGAKAGLVPAPSTTAGTTKYLREDGTWQVPPDTNTTYTAASATPLVAGTAAVGTSAKYAREDHVHPAQTSVSGNAGTATKIQRAPNGTTYVSAVTAGNALVNSTTTNFGAVWNAPTKNYRVGCATHPGSNDDVYICYSVTNANVTAGTNTTTKTLTWNANTGVLNASGGFGGNAATVNGTAGTSTLAWNSEVTLYTVGGHAIKAKLPANPNTDTHWTTHLYVGASDGSANAATTNGNTYLMVLDNSSVRDRRLIKGTGATTVTSDANGVITINSTDTNTTYGAASTSANGLVTTGGQSWAGQKAFTGGINLYKSNLRMTVNKGSADTTDYAVDILKALGDNAGYGINLCLCGSGNTIIGGGESGSSQLTDLKDNSGENLYLTADGNIYLKTNGNTWANAKTVTLDNTAHLSGLAKVTATTFVGALQGNVTGNCSGSSGSCTGNAATATKATQDGSGNTITSTYVNLTGAQTITACKTFKLNNQYIKPQYTDVTKGTNPSATHWSYQEYLDSAGTRLGWIGHSYTNSGDTSLRMEIVKQDATTASSMGIGYNSSKVVYTWAPHPPAANSSAQIATTAWVMDAANRRQCLVGQSGSTNTNPWYKFASFAATVANDDPQITFYVEQTYSSRVCGILRCHVRLNGSIVYDSCSFDFLANTGLDPAKFMLVTRTAAKPTIELWVKIDTAYLFYRFVVISEGKRTSNSNVWTLYNAASAGQAANPTSGTQVTPTIRSVSNKAVTLAWNTNSTIATVNGADITVKLPANPNTNTTYSAGTGLSLSGTTFSVASTAGTSALAWNSEVTLGTVGGLAIKAKLPANPNTNTTYSAGAGLALSSTTFSAQYLPSTGTPNRANGFAYTTGGITIGTAAGQLFKGSSNNAALISAPESGTYYSSTAGNVQNLRLSWSSDGKYFTDIFASPNNVYLWHRDVTNGTAHPWRRLVEENASGITAPSWNISVAGNAATVSGTAGTSALAWNSEVTLYTVGGHAIKAKLPANPNTDTHWTSHLYAGGSGATANAATTNGGTYLSICDNSTSRNSIKITGSGATTVTSDASGVITINSITTDLIYSIARASYDQAYDKAKYYKIASVTFTTHSDRKCILLHVYSCNGPAIDARWLVRVASPAGGFQAVTSNHLYSELTYDQKINWVEYGFVCDCTVGENNTNMTVNLYLKIAVGNTIVDLKPMHISYKYLNSTSEFPLSSDGNNWILYNQTYETASTKIPAHTCRADIVHNYTGIHYCTCLTNANIQTKEVTDDDLSSLVNGKTLIYVYFKNGNTASKPALKVNNLASAYIQLGNGSAASIQSGHTYPLLYTSGYWEIIG